MADRTRAKTFDCNWIPLGNGRLTLWHRPGAKALQKLRTFGCDCVLTLLSFKEGAPAIGKMVEKAGIEWLWLPLENGQPPEGAAARSVLSTLPVIADRLESGRSILVHCSAGIHRTGMVAYALLRYYGRNEEQALADIGEMRAHTRENLQRKQIEWGTDAVCLGQVSKPFLDGAVRQNIQGCPQRH